MIGGSNYRIRWFLTAQAMSQKRCQIVLLLKVKINHQYGVSIRTNVDDLK